MFNAFIGEFVDLIHSVGGLCIYDQANANALLGVTRAADAGFDACQFNLQDRRAHRAGPGRRRPCG